MVDNISLEDAYEAECNQTGVLFKRKKVKVNSCEEKKNICDNDIPHRYLGLLIFMENPDVSIICCNDSSSITSCYLSDISIFVKYGINLGLNHFIFKQHFYLNEI